MARKAIQQLRALFGLGEDLVQFPAGGHSYWLLWL